MSRSDTNGPMPEGVRRPPYTGGRRVCQSVARS
jgi:hypothetical protein